MKKNYLPVKYRTIQIAWFKQEITSVDDIGLSIPCGAPSFPLDNEVKTKKGGWVVL